MKSKKSIFIIFLIICVAIVLVAGYFIYQKYLLSNIKQNPTACTMEAKICPDGSSVGRQGPNCEFAQCPNQNSEWKTYTNSEYGFEFKYPKDWNYNGEESIVFSPNNIPLRVSVENKISDYYFSVSIDKNWSSSNYNYDAPTKEQVIIDGVKYTAYIFPRGYEVYEPEAGKDYSTFTIPVKKGNLYYIISGQGHANNLANYSEIISSFKFTK